MNELIVNPNSIALTIQGHEIVLACRPVDVGGESMLVPAVIVDTHADAGDKFVEWLTAHIRNRHTRRAYLRAVRDFCAFLQIKGWTLRDLKPAQVALYIEWLGRSKAPQTVKQSLAALRMLGDHLVVSQILPTNPAKSVRGPRYSIAKGKTPVLDAVETRAILDAIDASTIGGLRDRALIATMVFSFARIGAVLQMNVGDYAQQGKRCWLRLHEKNGKYHEVPAHHLAEEYLDAYLVATGIAEHAGGPLFRSLSRRGGLSERRLDETAALRIVKKHALKAGLGPNVSNHSFRATGITVFLLNGGTLEAAQRIACHSSPRTTKLYDRSNDAVTLDEIECIRL